MIANMYVCMKKICTIWREKKKKKYSKLQMYVCILQDSSWIHFNTIWIIKLFYLFNILSLKHCHNVLTLFQMHLWKCWRSCWSSYSSPYLNDQSATCSSGTANEMPAAMLVFTQLTAIIHVRNALILFIIAGSTRPDAAAQKLNNYVDVEVAFIEYTAGILRWAQPLLDSALWISGNKSTSKETQQPTQSITDGLFSCLRHSEVISN